MKRLQAAAIAVLAVLALSLSGADKASAQTPQSPVARIAIVDLKLIEGRAAAAVDMRRQVAGFRDSIQAQLAQRDEALKAERRQLEADRALLAPDLFRQRGRELQQRIADFQREVQEGNRQLDQTLNRAKSEFRLALGQVIAEVATAHGANIVIRNEQVLLSDGVMNITQAVLNSINARMQTMTVTLVQN